MAVTARRKRRTLTTRYWRSPWTDRYGHKHEGKWITRTVRDVGKLGRGKKVLPPVKKPGAMTEIANQLGYSKPSEVQKRDVPEFCDLLVKKYGKKSALGMIRRQLVYRQNRPSAEPDGTSRSIFQSMWNYIVKTYPRGE